MLSYPAQAYACDTKESEMQKTYRFVDFHSHILPGVDDGSQSVEESLYMIDALAAQNVCCIAATPHFYALSDHPSHFLKKREKALALLNSNRSSRVPVILPGAEVYYFEGIAEMSHLDAFKLYKTDYLLVEMPDGRWNDRMVRDLLSLQARPDFNIVLAHIERFMEDQDADTLRMLRGQGVLFQVNASFFTEKRTRARALRMLKHKEIAVLGTDCHNLTNRAPNYQAAVDVIRAGLGEDAVQSLERRSMHMIMRRAD